MNPEYGYDPHSSRSSPSLPLYQTTVTPQINLPGGYQHQPYHDHQQQQQQVRQSPYSPAGPGAPPSFGHSDQAQQQASPAQTLPPPPSNQQQRHSVHGSMPAYSIDQAFANVNPGSLTDARGRFALGSSAGAGGEYDQNQQQQQRQYGAPLHHSHQQSVGAGAYGQGQPTSNRQIAGTGGSTSSQHFLEPFTSALARSASLGTRRKGGGADDIEAGMAFGSAGASGGGSGGLGACLGPEHDVENGDGDGFGMPQQQGSRWGFGKTSAAVPSTAHPGYGSTSTHRASQSAYDPYGTGSGASTNMPYMGDAPQLGLEGQTARRTSFNRASFASPTSPTSGMIPPPSAGGRSQYGNIGGGQHQQQLQQQQQQYQQHQQPTSSSSSSYGQGSRPGYSPGGMSSSLANSPYMQGSQMGLDEPPYHSLAPGGGPFDHVQQHQQQHAGGGFGQPRKPLLNRTSSSNDSSNGGQGFGFPSSNVPAKRERNSSGSSAGAGSSAMGMSMTGIESQHSPIGQFSTSPLLSQPASVPTSTHPPPAALGGPRQALANRSRSSQQLNSSRASGGAGGLSLQPSAMGPAAGIVSAPGISEPPRNLARAREAEYEMTGISRASTSTGYAENDKRVGLRKVIDPATDLRPSLDSQPGERRADPDVPGAFLSPLKCLTTQLAQTYSICDPSFRYEATHNPRRVLTKPSQPCHNNGSDNQDYDYILYVNDVLTADNGTGDKYLILDVLGQGTFGQVAKCQNIRTHEIVAVKVVKNKPAYFNQSTMEVAILQLLNSEADPKDEHHILRMRDQFIHHKHLCIVFECLSSNLYELIKHNQFRGLSLQLVKMFTTQLLDALTVLKEARLIHCDLKPENILLKSLNSPQIKVIDFGSACHERQTVYTYIQSRFYRSPEVLLGLPYSAAIDMWSLGCIVVELFLGLPIFPGTSEFNQVSRITDMLGNPPMHLLEVGKQVNEFFNVVGSDDMGRKKYALKPMEQYAREHQTDEQPSKQYFKATKLPDIIKTYTLPKKITTQSEVDKEMYIRTVFIDFVQGLLNMDPIKRWSPQQAKLHPFITGERFTGHWEPTQKSTTTSANSVRQSASTESRSQQSKYANTGDTDSSRATRGYADANAYNQQAAQQQQYTAQQQQRDRQQQQQQQQQQRQQQQQQEAKNAAAANRKPYFTYDAITSALNAPPSQTSPYQSSSQSAPRMPSQPQSLSQNQIRAHQAQPRIPSNGHGLTASMSAGNYGQRQAQGDGHLSINVSNPPPSSYYPQAATRSRANTINRMDVIPPALARLTHLGAADPAGTRSALTPVLNRDDAIREWERRNTAQLGHAKRASIAVGNPQLDFLQEQAEMMGQAWQSQYGNSAAMQAYRMQPPPPVLEASGRPSQHRSGLSTDFGIMEPPSSTSASSPRTYGDAGGSGSNSAYLPAFPPPAASALDSYDPRGDAMAMMYTPLQANAAGYHKASGSVSQQNPFATAPNSPQYGSYMNTPYSPRQARKRSAGDGNGTGYGGA